MHAQSSTGKLTQSSLATPGPMLPPAQAIVTSVRGKPGDPDELAVLWTFVVNGDPAQVGVSAGDEHIAGGLITLHREIHRSTCRRRR